MEKLRTATSYRLSEEAARLVDQLAARLGLATTSVHGFLDLCIPAESGEASLNEGDFKRIFCHALLQHLDERGLNEALSTLADMVQFYRDPPPPCRVLPQTESVPVDWGETRIRPVYPVTEDD